MSIEQATQVLTSTMKLVVLVIEFGTSLVNPTDPGSTIVDWIFAVSVITPVSFVVMRYVVALAAGFKYKKVTVRKVTKKEERWTHSKFN